MTQPSGNGRGGLTTGALLASAPDLALSLLWPAAVPSAAAQFGGCPVSGTWEVTSGGVGTFNLREDVSNQITGTNFTFGFDPTSVQRVTSGNRNGNAVTLVVGTIVAGGQMSSCDSMTLFAPAVGVTVTLTRTSTSYCGDGTEDAGEGVEGDVEPLGFDEATDAGETERA